MAKSEKEVPVAEVSNEVQRECLSQSVQMALEPFTENILFAMDTAPTSLEVEISFLN